MTPTLDRIESHLDALADLPPDHELRRGRSVPDTLAALYGQHTLEAWLAIRRGVGRLLVEVRCGIGEHEKLDEPIDDPEARGRLCRRPLAVVHQSPAGAVLIDFGELGEKGHEHGDVLSLPPVGPAVTMLASPHLGATATGMCNRHGITSYRIDDLRALTRTTGFRRKPPVLHAR